MDDSSSLSISEEVRRSYSLSSASVDVLSSCSNGATSASRRAVGGIVPGFERAWLLTKVRALLTAARAVPIHVPAQIKCETGTIVWLEIREKGTFRIC